MEREKLEDKTQPEHIVQSDRRLKFALLSKNAIGNPEKQGKGFFLFHFGTKKNPKRLYHEF